MSEKIYDVILQTQLGIKKGVMCLWIDHGRINGHLDILKHSKPFYGEIEVTGACTLCGEIETLMRLIHYTATGYIDKNSIRLILQSANEEFEMIGIAQNRRYSE